MKKFILVFVSVITMFSMTSCSTKKCDICDGFGADYVVQAVTTWHLCYDCYCDLENDNDYDDYDYDDNDDYDDYDDDYEESNNYSNNRCTDCGKSIPSNRYYCDKCLGYGTCQDCGKKIADDRFYCDKCLGYGTCQDCGMKIADDRFYCNACLYD